MLAKRRTLQPGERIRVLIVDDSVVIRRLVSHALQEEPSIEVVGTAANGSIALQRIPQLNPDLITLDVEMPGMNGLELLKRVRSEYPSLRVIMFSTLTGRGAPVTLDALALGADDYVAKASNEGSLDRSLERLRGELIPKIKQFFQRPTVPPAAPAQGLPTRVPAHPASAKSAKRAGPKVVAIGVSTGGPAALAAILPSLPANFPLPILIVQHMPPVFTRLLAERLSANCALKVEEAKDGQPVMAGKILIAPGDFHMRLASSPTGIRIALDQTSPLNSCRPAVDALFNSVGEIYGAASLAAVLTGMGQDGFRGAQVLRSHGATILAQDEASSVVWGMPGAVVAGGVADTVLPLEKIVPTIVKLATSN